MKSQRTHTFSTFVWILSWRTVNFTTFSVPCPTFSTGKAKPFLCKKGFRRADIDTRIIKGIRVARAIRTFGAEEKNIRSSEMLNIFFIVLEMIMKLEASPLCMEKYGLFIMVDNKSSNTKNTSIISGNGHSRSIGESSSICLIISVVSCSHVQWCFLKGYIANIYMINFCDSGDWKNNSYSSHVGSWLRNLNFVRGSGIFRNLRRSDLKSVKEKIVLERRSISKGGFEREEYTNLLPICTPRQLTRVYLIITWLYIKTIFSKEGEGYSNPSSIVPLSPDYEWDKGQAYRSHRLYKIKQIIPFLWFKIMNT